MIKFLLVLLISTSAWAQGGFHFYQRTQAPTIAEDRDIYVYLPEGYDSSRDSYPVIYMHDGQNLFNPSRARFGKVWQAESILNKLIAQKTIQPVIVVGIDCSSNRRLEYIPENKGDMYLDFVTQTIKPQIERDFRVLTGPENTAIMGSSLGGLISLYAGQTRAHIFGKVAALSPSIWWNNRSIMQLFNAPGKWPLKLYIDSGTIDGEDPQAVRDLATRLQSFGAVEREEFWAVIQPGGMHNEDYWAQRLPATLRFLFPYYP